MLNSRLRSLVLFLALAEALFVRVLVGGWGAGLVSKGHVALFIRNHSKERAEGRAAWERPQPARRAPQEEEEEEDVPPIVSMWLLPFLCL